MANERQDEAGSPAGEERPKRPPPTIDLNAADVSDDTQTTQDANNTAAPSAEQADATDAAPRPRTGGRWLGALIAPLSGALAALIVTALLLFGGLISLPQPVQPAVSPGQLDKVATDVGDLTTRLTRVEANAAKAGTPAADPALLARAGALETSVRAMRDDLAGLKAQAASTASALADLKSTPVAGDSASLPNLAPLIERLTRLEQTAQTLSTDLAARKVAPDDANVRRLVVSNTLEAAVQSGAPFANALAAAKPFAVDPASLAPLEAFAAKGIPNDTVYLREIVAILRQVASSSVAKTAETAKVDAAKAPANAGVLDTLQAGLSKLVRIERSGATPAAQGGGAALVASVEASARRDDFAAVRRDLAKLPQVDNPQVQGWIKSVDARDAALAAARQFSAQALAAFTKSGQ
jgi:hypothetical protein